MCWQKLAIEHYSDLIQHSFSTRDFGRHFFTPQVIRWSRLDDHVDQQTKDKETPIVEVVGDQLSGLMKPRTKEETSEMKTEEIGELALGESESWTVANLTLKEFNLRGL